MFELRELIFGDGDVCVGESGATDGAEMIELDDQAMCVHAVKVSDVVEGLAFALLGALAVAGVEQCDIFCAVSLDGDGGADAGVHAAAEEHDGFFMTRDLWRRA